jgi:hypothetical protein
LANSKWDESLLRPVGGKPAKKKSSGSSWDESKLRALKTESLEEESAEDENQFMPPERKKGWPGVAQDIGDIPKGIGNFIGDIPKNAAQGWGQIFKEPGRAVKNVAAGFGEAAESIPNAPHNLLKYLKEKGIQGAVPYLEKYTPYIPDLGIEKKLGLDIPHEGDTALRQMGMFLPLPKILPQVPGIKGAIEKQTGRHSRVKDLKNKLQEAGLTAEDADRFLKQAESEAHIETGATTPNGLARKQKLGKENIAALEEKLTNIGAFPKTQAPKSPELPPEHQFESMSEKTAPLLKTAEQKSAETEQAIKTHLGEGKTHHLHYGTEIEKGRKAVEELNNKNYEPVNKELKENNVVIKEPEEAQKVAQHVADIIGSHDIWSKEVNALPEQVEAMNKGESVSANTYLQLYRDTQKAAIDAYHDMKDNGGTTRGQEAYDRMRKLQALGGQMWGTLEKSLPEETMKKLKEAQTFFKENVVPMRQNPTFHKVKKKGKVKGIMEANIGTEEGQDLLRQMTFNNPEALKSAVGEKFSSKPQELFKPNEELETNYLPRMPELQKLMQEHREAAVEHKETNELHKQALEHDKEQKKIAEERAKERSAIQNKHEQKQEAHLNIRAAEEASNAETKAKTQKEINKEKEKLAMAERHHAKIKGLAEAKNQSLKNKMQHEKDLKEAEKEVQRIRRNLSKMGHLTLKIARKILP